MKDNEIIKALECCSINGCKNCKYKGKAPDCMTALQKDTIDLINRQKAEIESLKHRKTELQIRNQELQHEKSEAIKEFAERLKTETFLAKAVESVEHVIWMNEIDNIVKEMTEVETNQRKEDEGK